MSEIDAMKTISELLENLAPDERARVLTWAQSKFGATPPTGKPASPAPAKSAAKGKTSKKAKTIISMDKSLDLSPAGKQSAAQFASIKAPTNVLHKCLVAVYYLRDIVELKQVTAQAVFTFFKTLQWPAPTDLKNTLQQAGSQGWLDTADSNDIKLTSLGENLVEHKLPGKKA